MALKLYSPAKINLFLRIHAKRPDGYHGLSSLFQTLDLADEINYTILSPHESDKISCTDSRVPTNESNLVFKAAKLFREKTGKKFSVCIDINKKIPIEAGLGGGSSNAATTLWALNRLLETSVSEEELMTWGAEIGSDVPFFFSHGTAYCTGRGEIVEDLPALSTKDVWLAKPSIGLSTVSVYKAYKPLEVEQRDPKLYLQKAITNNLIPFNDLEIPAFELLPMLKNLKQKLINSGFNDVTMSGSGSSFFCFGNGQINDQDLFVCKTKFHNRQKNSWY